MTFETDISAGGGRPQSKIGYRVWLTVGSVVLLGSGLIAAGGYMALESYSSSVLANLGTTVLLAVPILVLERSFDRLSRATIATQRDVHGLNRRVAKVAEDVADVGDRLDRLGGRIDERIEQQRADDAESAVEPVREMLAEPSYGTIRSALRRALSSHAQGGSTYLPLQESKVLLKVSQVWDKAGEGLLVEAEVEGLGTPEAGTFQDAPRYVWRAGESTEDFFVGFDKQMRRVLGVAAAPRIDARQFLAVLARTLDAAFRHAEATGKDAWRQPRVVASPSKSWLILGDRLQHTKLSSLSFPRDTITASGPGDAPKGDDILDLNDFRYAWPIAYRLYKGTW
ncbi:DUF948 domain-containing protein [Actinomycetospora flava]|uniref:DUF948 domain-containing protein n=1 Tax=Actinomycetospora flava TaxID=3129232 RepID=A0ABU8M998_9PSEU